MEGFGFGVVFSPPPRHTVKKMQLPYTSFKVSTAPSLTRVVVPYKHVFFSIWSHCAAIACRSNPSGGLLRLTCDAHSIKPEVAEGGAMFLLAGGAGTATVNVGCPWHPSLPTH